MTNALGHDFVGFLAVFGRHNIRPPHFASKVSYSASPQTFAECSRSPLVDMHNRYIIWSKIVQNFLYFEHATREDIAN
jgi:hypothetical protein